MTINIDLLPQVAAIFMLIFARIGTMVMLMPALGETMVPARLRLGIALALTLVFFPLISGSYRIDMALTGAVPASSRASLPSASSSVSPGAC